METKKSQDDRAIEPKMKIIKYESNRFDVCFSSLENVSAVAKLA